MDPEEVRVAREQDAAFMEGLEGLELDEKIAAVEREIEALELMESGRGGQLLRGQ